MKVITICRNNEDKSSSENIQSKQPIEIKDAVDYIKNHKYHFTEDLMNYAVSKM